jgi:hypothetical protein
MAVFGLVRKLWWREKKVTWTMRLAGFFSRSRTLALFGGAIAVLGAARGIRRRASHA